MLEHIIHCAMLEYYSAVSVLTVKWNMWSLSARKVSILVFQFQSAFSHGSRSDKLHWSMPALFHVSHDETKVSTVTWVPISSGRMEQSGAWLGLKCPLGVLRLPISQNSPSFCCIVGSYSSTQIQGSCAFSWKKIFRKWNKTECTYCGMYLYY